MADSCIAEEWRTVEGAEGYEVSSNGRVRSWRPTGPGRPWADTPRILKPVMNKDGCPRVKLSNGTCSRSMKVSRLVCLAFHGAPFDGHDEVIVVGEDKSDCSADNVRWGTTKADPNSKCKADGCDGQARSLGYCGKHYQRLYHHGSLHTGRTPPGSGLEFIKEHVSYSFDDCLIYPYSRGSAGYGYIHINGRRDGVHVVMCRLVNGPPPAKNMVAAHSCGNGHLGCVNPRHLRWATQSENMMDKIAHETMRNGEKAPNAKLSEADVIWMRKNFPNVNKAEMSRKFGVTFMTVTNALRGANWSHLNEVAPPPDGA